MPKFKNIDRTKAVFQNTVTTYNDSTVVYSSSTQAYGGADRFVDIGPTMHDIDDIKPVNFDIQNI